MSYRINRTDMDTDIKFLKSLARTIDSIGSRIERHGTHIGGHETRTRVVLIDPLLRSLGWNTEDPEMVVHEYGIGSLKVDYALFSKGEVFGILEAKAFGRKLKDEAWGKFVAELPQVTVVAFTDGDEWRFFRKSNKWQPETVKVSETPGGAFQVGFEIYEKIGRREVPPPPPPPPPNGITLPDLLAQMMAGEFPKGKKPTRVSFDGVLTELPKRTWKQMYATVASHLVTDGVLNRGKTPIKRPIAKKPLVSRSQDGFNVPVDIGGGLWLEANVNANGAVANSIFLLQECGVDPSTVRVHFD